MERVQKLRLRRLSLSTDDRACRCYSPASLCAIVPLLLVLSAAGTEGSLALSSPPQPPPPALALGTRTAARQILGREASCFFAGPVLRGTSSSRGQFMAPVITLPCGRFRLLTEAAWHLQCTFFAEFYFCTHCDLRCFALQLCHFCCCKIRVYR
jgi:hypothetical protein